MQDEPLFLLYESNINKAAVLNNLTGAEVIQNSIKSFNKELNANARQIKSNETDIESFEGQLDKLSYLKKFEKKLKKIKKKQKILNKLQEKYEKAVKIKQNLKKYQRKTKVEIPDLSRILKKCNKLSKKREILNKVKKINRELLDLWDKLRYRGELLQEYKKDLEMYKSMKPICPECGRPL